MKKIILFLFILSRELYASGFYYSTGSLEIVNAQIANKERAINIKIRLDSDHHSNCSVTFYGENGERYYSGKSVEHDQQRCKINSKDLVNFLNNEGLEAIDASSFNEFTLSTSHHCHSKSLNKSCVEETPLSISGKSDAKILIKTTLNEWSEV